MDSIYESVYKKIEENSVPIILFNANKIRENTGIDREEIIQELKLALVVGLKKYDYNTSMGMIYSFVKQIISNRLKKILKDATRKKRRPVACIRLGSDRLRWVSVEASIVDTFKCDIPDCTYSPDRVLLNKCSRKLCSEFYKLLDKSLDNERDKNVLKCFVDPSIELQYLMFDNFLSEPNYKVVCEYLNLTRIQTKWSLNRVRKKAIKLIDSELQFDDFNRFDIVKNEKVKYAK